ncbi:WecB/TagA/CpsF family glycosyltransferase [Herbiconiux sp. 11R-BC]|uniref:WecB/TagA/CpsF family glycosyltransferase n=1 Tax=Herbiconiux sp. 11R-BC TaxID=3111637 RepID=UPI003BFB8E95
MAIASNVEWGGLRFTAANVDTAADMVLKMAAESSSGHVHLCNSWTVVVANDEPAVMEVLKDAGAVNLVDGVPLAKVLSAKSGSEFSTSRGPSLFETAVPRIANAGLKQLFLGSTPEVLARIEGRLGGLGLDPSLFAFNSPPYAPVTPESTAAIVEIVSDARPDIVWVGLGTPKQDLIARNISEELGIPAICVGAAFDFYAGSVKEAPKWVQGSGFEWLYRFAAEPRRLWRRYTYGNVKFVRLARTVK